MELPAPILVRSGDLALRILAAIVFVAWQPATCAKSHQTTYVIDDFEGPTPLESWRLYSSPEPRAPGAALALGPGHRGHGAVLAYRIACHQDTACDGYAAAFWKLPSPLPKRRNPAISLWIRFLPDVEVSLVAKDTTGQTSRFPILATLEYPKAGGWQYVAVSLSTTLAGDAAEDVTSPMKRPLAEIGILVQPRAGAPVHGTVSFDDILLRDSFEAFHFDSAAQVGPAARKPSELAPIGVNIHLLRDKHALDLAREAGFSFVRMDMLWTEVERAGRYRFFPYDALLRVLDARGMGVLWILDYGHPDHGGSTPRTPQDIAAFGRFAGAAAAHFKGRNVRYEVWNEPNTGQFWAPSPNADEYAALLRETVAAIRRADPSAKVSTGGVSRIDVPFLRRAVDPTLAADLSAISIHPYPKTEPETIAPSLEILREWTAQAIGEHIEIWDTEWGYSSANAPKGAPSNGHGERGRRRQAGLAVREILTVWSLGFPLGVWYDLRDDGPDTASPEDNYGLLDSSGGEKPAMTAVRTLMSAVRGRKYVGMVQETPAGIHAMRMDGWTDTLFIVWSDRPGNRRKVEYAKHGLLSATDLMGKAVKSKGTSSGLERVEIDEAAGPIYLLWTAESRGILHPDPAVQLSLSNR
jgi:hypothetical protein